MAFSDLWGRTLRSTSRLLPLLARDCGIRTRECAYSSRRANLYFPKIPPPRYVRKRDFICGSARVIDVPEPIWIDWDFADVPWAVFASRSYIERYGRPDRSDAINRHAIIDFDGDIKEHHAAKWLRLVAPNSRAAGRCSRVSGLFIAVASGAGIAPLPLPLAARDPDLVRVFGRLPGLFSPIYLLTHPDLRRAPRISAFFEMLFRNLTACARH
jgi:DNA-binding transcriptional LysR family regulator